MYPAPDVLYYAQAEWRFWRFADEACTLTNTSRATRVVREVQAPRALHHLLRA
jgi:hypothetical protein